MKKPYWIMAGGVSILLLCLLNFQESNLPTLSIGSKTFTEGYILAEILSQILEETHEVKVLRHFGMGGTGILAQALRSNEIDLYPEYTGTISEVILKDPSQKSIAEIREALHPFQLTITNSLGFQNSYALAMRQNYALENRIKTISDLARTPNINIGISREFMNRSDGFPSLVQYYHLTLNHVKPLEHALALEALRRGEIELTDVYSTEAQIEKFQLQLLQDDKKFLPHYQAVVLAREAFVTRYPKLWTAIRTLEGKIDESTMIQMNYLADIEKQPIPIIAATFLRKTIPSAALPKKESVLEKVGTRTRQHLYLVTISSILSTLAGIPLGILASRNRIVGQAILMSSSVIQTIPSLALLCFLIPLFGIGTRPALAALFLYGLLPVVLNTYTGIKSIDLTLLEISKALGLSSWQQLKRIELPMAAPQILAGIKTAVIISIGTATLAALIGAGGYGVPIVTGLTMNDIPTILLGAIPAAGLALLTHGLFELLSGWVIPQKTHLKNRK